jgi:hypothetical protein
LAALDRALTPTGVAAHVGQTAVMRVRGHCPIVGIAHELELGQRDQMIDGRRPAALRLCVEVHQLATEMAHPFPSEDDSSGIAPRRSQIDRNGASPVTPPVTPNTKLGRAAL